MFPVQYIEPVFRPPSEAHSFILQVTNGCSWNQCTFCEMYTQPQKKFRARKDEDIRQDLERMRQAYPGVRRVFLADGDAMVLPVRRLKELLGLIRETFPELERVSSYCLPRNLNNKTVDDLAELKALGLDLLYVGVESGDDTVLTKVNKGESYASSLAALGKIRDAGLRSSVMVLNGLGGREYSKQHALESARLMNEAQPDFLSTLVVSFPMGDARLKETYPEFELPDQRELFEEMYLFLQHLELNNTVFRSDHASNYLVLKGELGRDKARMLAQLEQAIHRPEQVMLRPEWARGL